jgi:hypothetical protein
MQHGLGQPNLSVGGAADLVEYLRVCIPDLHPFTSYQRSSPRTSPSELLSILISYIKHIIHLPSPSLTSDFASIRCCCC